MNFSNIPAGSKVFLDSNSLIYHFISHPQFGSSCTDLLQRIENQDIQGFACSHVLAEMAHRLMTIEACQHFGWPSQGIARRLRNNPAEIQKLSKHTNAIDELNLIGVKTLPVTASHVSLAADAGRQYGLLITDALIVTMMNDQGLTHLASNDADFDRVPGITRYSPV